MMDNDYYDASMNDEPLFSPRNLIVANLQITWATCSTTAGCVSFGGKNQYQSLRFINNLFLDSNSMCGFKVVMLGREIELLVGGFEQFLYFPQD